MMTSLNVCFTKYSVKSQPEVGLSQDLFDFGQLEHDFTINPTTIPIPPNALPHDATDVRSGLNNNNYALSSFGSFSSAADSLVHDNAIVIPAYSPPSTPSTTIQDFCLLDDQDTLLNVPPPSQDPSLALLSSSACESDISFCSPTTPLSTMLSPYGGFSMDDMTLMSSPATTSQSPGSSWLATSMQHGLSLHSPSPQFNLDMSDMNSMDQLQKTMYSPSYGIYGTSSPQLQQQQQQQQQGCGMDNKVKEEQSWMQETATATKKVSPSRRREYSCPYCPRKSNRSNNMKEHILTHNPNRPKNFPCSICPKRFARKHDLKRHHQSHERNIEKMMVACGLVPRASPL